MTRRQAPTPTAPLGGMEVYRTIEERGPVVDAYTWDPVRDGWNVHEPRRRCYTCGARPVGRFGDGSPKYPSTCSHPPIAVAMAWTGPEPVTTTERRAGATLRTCPACRAEHPVLTTCADGWDPS